MTDTNTAATDTKKSIVLPVTVITGVIFAVAIGATYIFAGPDAAKALCSAVM